MATTFLPASDPDRVIWLNNFKTKISTYATTLGFTAAEVTAIQNDAGYYQYIVQMLDNQKQMLHGLSAYRSNLRSSGMQQALAALPVAPAQANPPAAVNSGIFNRITTIVMRIKRHPSYTSSIGQDLAIVTPTVVFDPATVQPALTVRLNAGRPYLRWNKGESDGANIYVDRNNGSGFTLLAKTFKHEFLDITSLPEGAISANWSYKVKYLIGDDEVGVYSDIVPIVTIRM
jgi:hypothetical protein